jgi:hypothetical protein
VLKRKQLRLPRNNKTFLLQEATDRLLERLSFKEHRLWLLAPLWVLWEALLLPVALGLLALSLALV